MSMYKCDKLKQQTIIIEINLSHMTLTWQTTYNLNEKGNVLEITRELTDTLECIEHAAPKAVNSSEGHNEWGHETQEASWV